MIRRILITSTILAVLPASALAQNTVTVVREAAPTTNQPIIANSPQDLAIQEDIRRINANNAHVNSIVGISESYSYTAPATVTPALATATKITPVVNKYEGAKVELFAPPATKITYASTPVTTQVPASFSTQKNVATYTRIHRVVKGDTLYNLARRNCLAVADIKNSNALNGSSINIGQALAMPASQCGDAKLATASAATPPATVKQDRSEFGIVRQVMPIQTGIKVRTGNAYAVLPKDSLYSIGKRYCLKAHELAAFNNIDTATPIQPGQILRLPSTTCN